MEPLLAKEVAEPVGAGFFSSVVNLIVNVLGVGVLTIAWALHQTSIVNGLALLTIMCALNVFSFHIIARCCDVTGSFSYLEMGRSILGPRGGILLQGVVLFHTYFSCVSYTIFIGDLLPEAISASYPSDMGLSHADFRALVIAVLALVVLTPLALVKRLEFLKYSSLAACFGIAYLICVVIYRYANPPLNTVDVDQRGVRLWEFRWCLLPAVPVFSLSFCAHFNGPDYFKELRDRTVARFTAVAASALTICLMVCVVVSIFGYLTWGSGVAAILLENYGIDAKGNGDTVVTLLKWIFSFVIACTLPSMFFSCKQAAFSLFWPNLDRSSGQALVIALLLLYSAITIGIVWVDITQVLVYLGAISGSCIVYIFPAVLWLRLSSTQVNSQELVFPASGGQSSYGSFLKDTEPPRSQGLVNFGAVVLLVWGIVLSFSGVIFEALTQSGVFSC